MPKIVEKRLTTLNIKRAKPGYLADGGGLYLSVRKSGSRSWVFRWRDKSKGSKLRMLGLGSAGDVSLANAREKATRLRQAVAEGRDPAAERDGDDDVADRVPAFEQAARQVHKERQAGWKNSKHQDQWINTLRDYVFSFIGQRPVDEIASGEVMEVLLPIWNTKPETARRVRQRMRLVFDWAIARQFREKANPVDALRAAMPPQPQRQRHFAAMPYAEIPAFLSALRQNERAHRLVRLALEFLILTAARTGEVLGARWDEIDREKAIWAVPAERMKAGQQHRVPLPDRCLDILAEAETLGSAHSTLIFPGRNPAKPLSNMTFAMVLRRMGHDGMTASQRMAFDPASETGRPSEPALRAMYAKRRWRIPSEIGSKRPIAEPICSSVDGC